MIEKLAENLVKHRFFWLGIILLVTLFFLWHMRNIQVESRFGDLLPQNHPYIKVHNQYKDQLGDPLKVFLMLQVKDGTIYTKETLQKVKRITDALDAITGVNHNQIYSIASQKIKKITVTSYGIISENFMEEVPETEQEMAAFAETVRNTSSVYGIWVSPNEKAVLFTAAFIGELVDYQNLFDAVKQIQQKESDGNHILYAAGEPVLTGWVYHYSQEMYLIFVVSIVALIGLLIFYFRNFIGVIVPAA
ncbi:MAG TPA: MMPL family transporter, partial [Thermodesulfobacteriota bacterium]|nr:MMPL family transporter [Thermodesulfobacteriota bacterium]